MVGIRVCETKPYYVFFSGRIFFIFVVLYHIDNLMVLMNFVLIFVHFFFCILHYEVTKTTIMVFCVCFMLSVTQFYFSFAKSFSHCGELSVTSILVFRVIICFTVCLCITKNEKVFWFFARIV